jgi:hypothetical protein
MADNAAVLACQLADLKARWLMGQNVDLANLVTIVNAYNRSAMALGLDRQARDVAPDLRRYLDERQPAAVQEPDDEHGATGAKSESAKPSQDAEADTGPPREIHESALNDREPAQNPVKNSEKNSVGENPGKNPSAEGF